jgi:hypothetical protein
MNYLSEFSNIMEAKNGLQTFMGKVTGASGSMKVGDRVISYTVEGQLAGISALI